MITWENWCGIALIVGILGCIIWQACDSRASSYTVWCIRTALRPPNGERDNRVFRYGRTTAQAAYDVWMKYANNPDYRVTDITLQQNNGYTRTITLDELITARTKEQQRNGSA